MCFRRPHKRHRRLGVPDGQEFAEQWYDYKDLIDGVAPFSISDPPVECRACLHSLDGRWFRCRVGGEYDPISIFEPADADSLRLMEGGTRPADSRTLRIAERSTLLKGGLASAEYQANEILQCLLVGALGVHGADGVDLAREATERYLTGGNVREPHGSGV